MRSLSKPFQRVRKPVFSLHFRPMKPHTAIARRASLAKQAGLIRGRKATQDCYLQRGEHVINEPGFGPTGRIAQAQHLPRDYRGGGGVPGFTLRCRHEKP